VDFVSSEQWLHPARLQGLGAAYGVAAPPPEASRVLCLVTHSNAEFAADLAGELPDVHRVGLAAAQSLEAAPCGRPFDYVLLPAGYAALNRAAQATLFATLARLMTPTGLLAVAYPTVVGAQLQAMVWEPLRQYAATFADPQAQLDAARGLLATLAAHLPCRPERGDRRDVYALLLRAEHTRCAQLDTAAFLRCLNAEPVAALAAHECLADAARAGLQYLGESDPAAALPESLSPLEALPVPDALRGRPEAEPWRDLLRGRLYRRSVFCRAPGAARPEKEEHRP
jgi:hypothetical protein